MRSSDTVTRFRSSWHLLDPRGAVRGEHMSELVYASTRAIGQSLSIVAVAPCHTVMEQSFIQ